jgi:hypothetical protein
MKRNYIGRFWSLLYVLIGAGQLIAFYYLHEWWLLMGVYMLIAGIGRFMQILIGELYEALKKDKE